MQDPPQRRIFLCLLLNLLLNWEGGHPCGAFICAAPL